MGEMEGLAVREQRPRSGPLTGQRQQSSRSGLAPIDHGRLACKAGEIIAKAVENTRRDAGRRRKGK
jgi:hypothetical protein